MNKTISIKRAISLIAFFTASAVTLTVMMFQFVWMKSDNRPSSYELKLNEIRALVDAHYIGEVDDAKLLDFMSAGYISGLEDKYSGYVPAADSEASMNSIYGYNTGMGIQVTMHPDNETIFVLEVHNDSPALKSGIKPLDEIIKIDDKTVSEYGFSESLAYIKSLPLNTIIHLVINRGEETVELDVSLTTHVSQSVFGKLFGDKGYIQIVGFNNMSVDQFTDTVDSLIEQGAKALIFDLRGNGGGTVSSVYHMLDYLLPEGLILEVKYKDKNNNQVYMSDLSEIDLTMVVLTDESTASASELFSQSIKDYKKGITIGRTTYGKGVVQNTYTLSDGSLVRFTVGKYYTNSGTCVDGIGVAPDIEVTLTEEEAKYRLVNGLLKDKDFLAAVEYLDGQLS